MEKVINAALSAGHQVTIERNGEFTVIKVFTEKGYFKHNGVNFITCSYYPEDEQDELNQLLDEIKLGLYQYN